MCVPLGINLSLSLCVYLCGCVCVCVCVHAHLCIFCVPHSCKILRKSEKSIRFPAARVTDGGEKPRRKQIWILGKSAPDN